MKVDRRLIFVWYEAASEEREPKQKYEGKTNTAIRK